MSLNSSARENIEGVALTLLEYCRSCDWAGHDPYDVLNSRVLKALPFLNFPLLRLTLTQGFKRSPINLRPLFLVPKTQNPKALSLFIMALVKLTKLGLLEGEALVDQLFGRLEVLRSPNSKYWCWGYSFPWQTRTIIVPRGAPNLVCTVFVANALLNAYERNLGERYLSMAVSAAEYILNELYWTKDNFTAGFSYPIPSLHAPVHNANLLGAALLCRTYKYCSKEKFLGPALKVARYSAAKQRANGSWDYGELPTQRWADNFHTGYNLCALRSIGRNAETSEFEFYVRRGSEFYRKHFFRDDGAPRYFHNRTYPIDIHNVAQSMITLLVLRDQDQDNFRLALSVLDWAMTHMWDKQGYFCYQVLPFYKIKTSYMRWSQAWMLLALSTLLEHSEQSLTGRQGGVQTESGQFV